MRPFLTLFLFSLIHISSADEKRPDIIIVSASSLPVPLLSGEGKDSAVSHFISRGVNFRYVWAGSDTETSDSMLISGKYKANPKPNGANLLTALESAGYQTVSYEQLKKETPKGPFFAWLKTDISDLAGLEEWLQPLTRHSDALVFITARKGKSSGDSSYDNAAVSVPLIVSGSCVRNPGRQCWDLVDLTDFFPTMMALAGVPVMECHGKSFVPSLNDSPDPFQKRNWIHTQNGGKWMIRDWANILHHDGTFLSITSGKLTTSPIRMTDKIAPHRLERLEMLADRLHKNKPTPTK